VAGAGSTSIEHPETNVGAAVRRCDGSSGLRASLEFRPVTVQDRSELIVFEISKSSSKVSFAQVAEVGKQLAQPHVR
jgi:hypothetical protein